jgi:hypothetical protein
MKTQKFADANVVTPTTIETRNWNAWINKMPPPPDTLHVRGEVEVSNPGVHVALFKKQPQGFNPQIILLELFLIQQPGIWPDVVTIKPAAYEEVGQSLSYTNAEVFQQGETVASMPVQIVQ